ncbi:MAG TPA: heavy metal-binding domain-containing protein [Chloroflexota bacterium]|nr:heavy metal-binding domain-containing protein [Chloroflexota bacterium]
MPLFHRRTDEERQRDEEQRRFQDQAQRDQQQSVASLEAGGLPVAATRRLQEVSSRQRLFTSDLSVDEFLLVKAAGFHPITQVTGSSIYHVGWQRLPGQSVWYRQSEELEVVTRAWNEVRGRALGRLRQEAALAGADAVVGVRVTFQRYDWGHDLIEFNLVGTAIRSISGPHFEEPVLSSLSGQEFWELYQAGYMPAGIVGGSSVFYMAATPQTQWSQSWFGSVFNQELQDFTLGLRVAQHRASTRAYDESRRLGATGIVGMRIEQEQAEYETEINEGQKVTDMIFSAHTLGTAIAQVADRPVPATTPVVVLRK